MEKRKLGPQTVLHPMPAVLVGANVNGKANFMTVAWCGIAGHKPPSVSVALRKGRYTLKGIQEHGTFSVNVPSVDLVKQVDYCGIYSGKERDKSQLFDLFYGALETAPLIRECPLILECKVLHTVDLGSHDLVIGEIMETYVDEDSITDGQPDPVKMDPVVYAPRTRYYHRLGEAVAKAFSIGKED